MIGLCAAEPVELAAYTVHIARFSESGHLLERWQRRPEGNHPDGWGVAYLEGERLRLVRSGMPAHRDPALAGIRARADRFIAHVRFASDPATIGAGNAHPFHVGGVVVAQNGTFKGSIGQRAAARGVSDTLVFAEILSARWEERNLRGLREALSRLLADADLVGEYSAANLLIGSGASLFAVRRFRGDGDYYTLFLRRDNGLAVAASEPLDDRPDWRLMADGEIVDLSSPERGSLTLAPAA